MLVTKKKGKGRGFFSTFLFQFHAAVSGKLKIKEIRSWKFIFLMHLSLVNREQAGR